MATDEDRFIARREFERENADIRKSFDRDIAEVRKSIAAASEQADRAEETAKNLNERLKYGIGLDLSNQESTSRFKLAVDWAYQSAKKLQDRATRSSSERLTSYFVACGAIVAALTASWPLIRKFFDSMLGAGH